ncbi:hypothetical protein [Acetobacterium woodii]|uniref:hypothetical protein n=1 Tax=Acetobacterium woodii TaxID=33952 RepID=UPI0003017140|nr:hypothetical protein [Acetobacterium woodii]
MYNAQVINGKKDENKITEIKLCCRTCPQKCEMTLLVEGYSIIYVQGDGCKKGRMSVYKEFKKRKLNNSYGF